MKICPYCRNTLATGQTICDMCGESVPDVEIVSKQIILKPKKAPKQVPAQQIDTQDTDKEYKRGLAIIISISAAILIGGIIAAILIFT